MSNARRDHRWLALVVIATLTAGACSSSSDSPATTLEAATESSPAGEAEPSAEQVTVESTPLPVVSAGADDVSAVPVLADLIPPDWEPETRTDELAALIAHEGGTELQTAIDALALILPDLPGATPSDLPPGDGFSVTVALTLAAEIANQVTPAQAAVLARLDPPSEFTAEIGLDGQLVTRPAVAGLRKPARQADAEFDRFVKLLLETVADWRAYRPGFPWPGVALDFATVGIGEDFMSARPDPARPEVCSISVYPAFRTAKPADGDIKEVFAHEMFHCLQFVWGGGNLTGIPQWVVEGGADFASYDLYWTRHSPWSPGLRTQWFTAAAAPLAVRTYAAWPLFATFALAGGDPYAAIQTIATNHTGDVEQALFETGMNFLGFRSWWSSTSLRSTKYPGPEWAIPWPGSDPGAGPRDNSVSFGSRGIGSYKIFGTKGFSHAQIALDIAGDVGILGIAPADSPVTLATAQGTITVPDGAIRRLCFDDSGCVCPTGSMSNTLAMNDRSLLISFAASKDGPHAQFKGAPWDPEKHCEKPEPSHRGRSNGDPHLVSFDGIPFDIMRLGEFVLARDTAGGFEVQTRHEALPGGGVGTSAVAIETGAGRVTLTVDEIIKDAAIILRLDGVIVDQLPERIGDVEVRSVPGAHRFTWPDGSFVEATFSIGWFVETAVTEERGRRMTGLLGRANDNFHDDLRQTDGTPVPPGADLDGTLAPAWQITAGETLFDYLAGEDVATFRDAVPPPPVTPTEEATQQCADALPAGVVPVELAWCAYDVTAAGPAGADTFVANYTSVVSQRVDDLADDPLYVRPTPPAGERGPSPADPDGGKILRLEGRLAESLAGNVRLAKGAVLLVRSASCPPDDDLSVRITGPDSSVEVFVCDPFGLASALADSDDEAVVGETYLFAPDGGTFEVSLSTSSSNDRFVDVEFFADPTPTTIDGDDLLDEGADGRLSGIGDVLLAEIDTGTTVRDLSVDGGMTACAGIAYGAPRPGDGGLWPISICPHAEQISIPPTSGTPVLLVVLSRQSGGVDIALTPR